MALQYAIDLPVPSRITIGKGVVFPIAGWCFDTEYEVKGISINIDSESHAIIHIYDLRQDVFSVYGGSISGRRKLCSGFYGLLPFPVEYSGKTVSLTLNVYFEHNVASVNIGSVYCQPKPTTEQVVETPIQDTAEPLIAICMATYNPKIDAFKKQMRSIISQTHQNWILIVNDDRSSEDIFRGISEVCAIDKRIHVFRNDTNLGFYKNFEKSLERVGSTAEYVAFADQDDDWYENKLSRCLGEMKPGVSLVYSDMRIVKADGQVISNSYWVNRRNYYKDISLLLLANTVTGAASLFRSSLLELLLPFPYRIGDIFHDQWLSVVARAAGEIRYIDEPLYDYIQHGANVLGHSNAQASFSSRLARGLKDTTEILLGFPGSIKPALKNSLRQSWDVYKLEFRRLELIAANLCLRVGNNSATSLSSLDMFRDRWTSITQLFKLHTRVLLTGQTTNHAEWRLLKSRFLVSLGKYYCLMSNTAVTKPDERVYFQPPELVATSNEVKFFEPSLAQKICPLELKIDESQPKRVNLLIPELNFDHLFGGYIGKFNFAIRLVQAGAKVRIVLVDYCNFNLEQARQVLNRYPGIEDLLEQVEISLQFDRQVQLSVSPLDSFIATTWWTAHIAHQACTHLKRSEFLYFIQEFEPFTFPMGAYFALARQSYDFSHSALFSTPLLMEYFQEQQIGVFAPDRQSTPLVEAFSNAIQTFELPLVLSAERIVKKLLFYARPEPHAARNMFELALMALNEAILSGAFDSDTWEFYGIGTKQPAFSLAGGHTLQMLGKVSLEQYRELLPQHDIGLALMYTPHPSLLPLEMAAAGMVVVTNTCLNKTADKMRELSPNIIAAEPTVEGVTECLSKAALLAGNWEQRRAGAQVNWSSSWEETFDKNLMSNIVQRLDYEH